MTMFHDPQYWATRVPMSLFEQTQYEYDQLFYATFPAARDAAYNAALEKSTYDLPRPADSPTFHAVTQPLIYDIRSELDTSSTSVSFSGPTQEQSYPQSHIDCYEGLHPQQNFFSHHEGQPSNYFSRRLIEKEAPVYIPPKQLYHHQYSFEPTSQYILQSHHSPVATREPAFPAYQPSNISPPVNTDIQETVSDDRGESPRYSFRQLSRHMKPPTLKFTNDCQLGVMRLDRLSDRTHLDSPEHSDQPQPSPSDTSPPSTPPPTEFLLSSAQSPSIGLSSLPTKNTPEKKPPLACLFCRGRKIACGAPLPDSIKKICNQCRKRGQECYYPTESRRGMRKKKPQSDELDGDKSSMTKVKRKKKSQQK